MNVGGKHLNVRFDITCGRARGNRHRADSRRMLSGRDFKWNVGDAPCAIQNLQPTPLRTTQRTVEVEQATALPALWAGLTGRFPSAASWTGPALGAGSSMLNTDEQRQHLPWQSTKAAATSCLDTSSALAQVKGDNSPLEAER